MSTCGRGLRQILTALAIVATAMPALAAEPTTEGETLIARGIDARRAGRARDALTLFERAYALDATPRASAQLALAHQSLGDWLAAEQGLTRALRADGDPWIALYRGPLESALAIVAQHLGWIGVRTNVAHGELRLGDGSRYDLPAAAPIRVASGKLQVTVDAAGYRSASRVIDVAPGAEVDVALDLDPIAPAISAPRVSRAVPAATEAPPAHRALVEAYLAFGAAGLLASAGVAAWRVREDNAAVYDDDSRCLVGSLTRAQQCSAQLHAANVALGVEVGSFVGAAAVAAFGGWRWWAARARPAEAAATCAPMLGLGVACAGQF